MKLLADFFPIGLFFIAYKFYGIYIATFIAIITSCLQVAIHWLRHRRLESTHLITLAIITVLGGATLVFRNEIFIKWKPTAINWALAIAFFVSQFIGNKPLIKRMMENNIELPKLIWTRLNLSWVAFFSFMGIANLYVVYHFDTDTWVNFKLFGMLGLTIIFVIGQALFLARHMEPEKELQ